MTAEMFIISGMVLFTAMLIFAGIKMFGYLGGIIWATLLGAGIVLYVNGKVLP